MKRIVKKAGITVSVLVVSGLIYLFLFGWLFPYSPVLIGFKKQELSSLIVCRQNKAADFDFSHIDSLLPAIEEFHELAFTRKPALFLFSDSLNYRRHSPSKARFCAFYNGRVFISPWAFEEACKGSISLETYLRHELSHSLIHQNAGFFAAARYPDWLLEGIAVYSSGQRGTRFYPSKEETYRLIRLGNFMPPDYFKTGKEKKIHLDVPYHNPFIYSEYGCMVDYLIERFGKADFLKFMKACMEKHDYREVFKTVYNLEFDDFVEDFRKQACTMTVL